MHETSKPIYTTKLSAEFDSIEVRDEFIAAAKALLTDEQFKRVELNTKATCCRVCGIERRFGTLGSGVGPVWDAVDECRGSHGMGCLRRQKANAAEGLDRERSNTSPGGES